mgnify:CR=1 FL=1
MDKKVLQAQLNIQGVSVTTYYGNKAIEKAEQYPKDFYKSNSKMRVYLEVTYLLS